MNRPLQDAVAKLYEAFANEPKPKAIAGCPCCIENKQIKILLDKSLREIAPDELYSYAFSLFLTVGDEADFKYFLPRIFDLLITDVDFYLDPEVALGKFRYVRLNDWQLEQKLAIANLIESILVNFVLSYQVDTNNYLDLDLAPDTWLCAIARLGVAIESLLTSIEEHPQVLVNLYEQNSETLIDGKLFNGFWNDIPKVRQTVIDWFQSDKIVNLMALQYAAIDKNSIN